MHAFANFDESQPMVARWESCQNKNQTSFALINIKLIFFYLEKNATVCFYHCVITSSHHSDRRAWMSSRRYEWKTQNFQTHINSFVVTVRWRACRLLRVFFLHKILWVSHSHWESSKLVDSITHVCVCGVFFYVLVATIDYDQMYTILGHQ